MNWSSRCALVALAATAALADTRVAAPPGAVIDQNFAAVAAHAIAVAIVFPATSRHQVQQWRSGTQVLTSLPGKIVGLEYSASGSHLLATYSTGGPPDGDMETAVALVSAPAGFVIRTWPSTGRSFHFTNDGTGVCAVAGLEGSGSPVTGVAETFALSGAPVMRQEWRLMTPTGVVGLGSGSRLITVLGSDLACVDASAGIVWRTRLAAGDRSPVALLPFSEDFVLLRQDYGWFSLVRPSGAIAYRYDPVLLAASHPPMTWEQFAQYEPHPLTPTKL